MTPRSDPSSAHRIVPRHGPPWPEFEPSLLWPGADWQTFAGTYLPGPRFDCPLRSWTLSLPDGDRIAVHETAPQRAKADTPTVILVHGLCGSYRSPYQQRFAGRLYRLGLRSIRMDQRGCGAGIGLARGLAHSGRSEDVRATLHEVMDRYPGARITLVGFSLGGNLVLKLAGELADMAPEVLDSVVAVNPPIDLARSCRKLLRGRNWLYHRYFVRNLLQAKKQRDRIFPDLAPVELPPEVSVYSFDDLYTAPLSGFRGAEDYYARCSAGPLIGAIARPALILTARDDPFIAIEPFRRISNPMVDVEITRGGGHLGYIHRRRILGDRRWMDHRVLAWITSRHGLGYPLGASSPAPIAPGQPGATMRTRISAD